ncbi:hypothetical protein KXD40_007214 [Peronospora effusa]|uniref:Uncharacterized protein n=1 Tax=Peronospora effusa TaxID=542832 RepID=A0A425CC10_9STRA|nr:hypothetical protein DD237_003137 [Peronospora effusa]UIZ29131.1 hypothetical protein KXD40_007214 [Peronospora effusa]
MHSKDGVVDLEQQKAALGRPFWQHLLRTSADRLGDTGPATYHHSFAYARSSVARLSFLRLKQ